MQNHYFYSVVLPSVQLPPKATYSIKETMKILDCSKSTFYKKVGLGEITITKDKRVYAKNLEDYFDHCNNNDCLERLKFTKS